MTWHIIVILAFVVIYNIYRYYREQKDGEYCPVIETISSDGKGQVTGRIDTSRKG